MQVFVISFISILTSLLTCFSGGAGSIPRSSLQNSFHRTGRAALLPSWPQGQRSRAGGVPPARRVSGVWGEQDSEREMGNQGSQWAGKQQCAVPPLLDFTPWRTGTFYGTPGPLTSSQYPFLSSPYQSVSWQLIMKLKLHEGALRDTHLYLFSLNTWHSLVCSHGSGTSH